MFYACGSRFYGIWEDPVVSNLTHTGILTRREVDSKRPTKKNFVKIFNRGKIRKYLMENRGYISRKDQDILKSQVTGAMKHKNNLSEGNEIP